MNYKKLFFLIITLSGICAISYYIYFNIFSSNKEIIILKPDDEMLKFKRKPEDRGGIIIPNSQSLIYEKLQSSTPLKLRVEIRPEPEKPLGLIFSQIADGELHDSIDDILAKLDFFENVEVGDNINDVDKIDNDPPLQKVDLNIIIPSEKIKKFKKPILSLDKKEPNGYKIQLSSARSLEEAKKEWNNLQKKYPKILYNKNLIIRKSEKTQDRIHYLILAGSYSNLNQAKLACKKLTILYQNCIVIE